MAKNPTDRQNLGQFFTPEQIAEFILTRMNLSSKKTIADLSCGDGIFLTKAFDDLQKKSKNEIDTISKLYGLEIDQKILYQARNKLLKKCKKDTTKKIIKKNIIKMNTVTTSVDAILKKFPFENKEKGFDVIVGNPPYVTYSTSNSKIKKDPIFSQIIHGQVNLATLVIGRAFSLLKKNGMLGLLLPKSLLRVKSYQRLRDFILKNFEIKCIVDVGEAFPDVRGEQIILIAQKKTSTSNPVLIGNWDSKTKKPKLIKIQKSQLILNGIFQIYENKNTHKLISKIISSHPTLEKVSDGKISRGIPIAANSKFVKSKHSPKYRKAIRGDSIQRFNFEYFLYIKEKKYPKLTDEIKGKKIVMQNIFSSESGIIANFDEKGVIPLDSVTVVMPQSENPYYILGILNSKLVQFFMIFAIFAKSRLTMHTDKHYLGLIPIPKTNRKLKNQIIRSVKLSLKGKHDLQLNSLIYSAFSISDKQIQLLEKELTNFRSNGKKTSKTSK